MGGGGAVPEGGSGWHRPFEEHHFAEHFVASSISCFPSGPVMLFNSAVSSEVSTDRDVDDLRTGVVAEAASTSMIASLLSSPVVHSKVQPLMVVSARVPDPRFPPAPAPAPAPRPPSCGNNESPLGRNS